RTCKCLLFVAICYRPPASTLFPYTTLFRSFKLVSDRLELVHKGLGEMHTLATDVGGLKRVLSNIKTRGTWGEVQLGALLDQVLTDRKSTRLNSSHLGISYAVFCLKKKKATC